MINQADGIVEKTDTESLFLFEENILYIYIYKFRRKKLKEKKESFLWIREFYRF